MCACVCQKTTIIISERQERKGTEKREQKLNFLCFFTIFSLRLLSLLLRYFYIGNNKKNVQFKWYLAFGTRHKYWLLYEKKKQQQTHRTIFVMKGNHNSRSTTIMFNGKKLIQNHSEINHNRALIHQLFIE